MRILTTLDNIHILIHDDGDVTNGAGYCLCHANLGTPEARKAAGQWLLSNLSGLTFSQAVVAYRNAIKRASKGAL